LTYTYSYCIITTGSVCQVRSNVCSDIFLNILVIDKSQLKILDFQTESSESPQDVPARFFFRLQNFGESNIVNYRLQVDVFKDSILVSNKTVILEKIRGYSKYPEEGNASVLVNFDVLGMHDVVAKIVDSTGGVVQSEMTNITIIVPPKMQTEVIKKDMTPGLFFAKIIYTAQNMNPTFNSVNITHPVFISKYIYTFSEEPAIIAVDGKDVFLWVCGLNAQGSDGDTYEVYLTVNYWIAYLAVLVLAVSLFYVFRAFERPRVKKIHVKKGNVHSIHIHVKNNSIRPIENVIITDYVPSVLHVLSNFTVKPTTMKKHHDSLELIWKIGKLKSKEERVLTYKVKPVVEVDGGITMPPVMICAVNSRGMREKVMSRSVALS
ncbi:MAG: hypothetical protein U9P44_03615, partial [archaeon]|nr:hypothetical protein [archaeon]